MNKLKRGFAAMSAERQKEIASMGGKAAHAKGKAHKYDSEEARAAGKKSHAMRKAHQFTSEEARAAGRKSRLAARAKKMEKLNETY